MEIYGLTLVAGVIASVIYLAVLWGIIAGATKSKQLLQEARMQTDLLKEIAAKSDVDPKKINEILEKHSK